MKIEYTPLAALYLDSYPTYYRRGIANMELTQEGGAMSKLHFFEVAMLSNLVPAEVYHILFEESLVHSAPNQHFIWLYIISSAVGL
jgi:hypothetical protein